MVAGVIRDLRSYAEIEGGITGRELFARACRLIAGEVGAIRNESPEEAMAFLKRECGECAKPSGTDAAEAKNPEATRIAKPERLEDKDTAPQDVRGELEKLRASSAVALKKSQAEVDRLKAQVEALSGEAGRVPELRTSLVAAEERLTAMEAELQKAKETYEALAEEIRAAHARGQDFLELLVESEAVRERLKADLAAALKNQRKPRKPRTTFLWGQEKWKKGK